MFQSYYFPNEWNERQSAELNSKDQSDAQELSNIITNNNFCISSSILALTDRFIGETSGRKHSYNDAIIIRDEKNLNLEFQVNKFQKIINKIYVPQIMRGTVGSTTFERYVFVDIYDTINILKSYPKHLSTNLIQFIKFVLSKNDKLTEEEADELWELTGFKKV
jgi:hypothetical protein